MLIAKYPNLRTQRLLEVTFERSSVLLHLMLAFSFVIVFLLPLQSANAAGPSREVWIERSVLQNRWHISAWETGSTKVLCSFNLIDGNFPKEEDITNFCSAELGEKFSATPSCVGAVEGGSTTQCTGLFYWYSGSSVATVKEKVQLPAPTVSFTLDECLPTQVCESRPRLNFIGNEPLNDFKIVSLEFRWGERSRSCKKSSCLMDVPITGKSVETLEFWAVSNYGDESEHYFISFRNFRDSQEAPGFHFDLLLEPYEYGLPFAAITWKTIPAMDDPSIVLGKNPQDPMELATTVPFRFLAGGLIFTGEANAPDCADGGLLPSGAASDCGFRAAIEETIAWQNKFDPSILRAANRWRVPAKLLKAMIAQESQFFPKDSDYETGLGRMTDNGSDLLLSWNPEYFRHVCLQVFTAATCQLSYQNQSEENQTLLRGAVLHAVGTDAEFEMLAATLNASTKQINQLLWNFFPEGYTEYFNYGDLWKLSVANYHTGSGCLSQAIEQTIEIEESLSWDSVSLNLSEGCYLGAEYVEKVMKLAGYIIPKIMVTN